MGPFGRSASIRGLLLGGVSLFILGATPVIAEEAAPGVADLSGWFEMGGHKSFGGRSRGEAVAFLPFARGVGSLVFGEARAKRFEGRIMEGNFAVGHRRMLDNGWNVGGWLGLDVREANIGGWHKQLAGGLELLGDDFDLRVNGYLPFDSTRTGSTPTTAVTTTVSGSTIAPTIVVDGTDIVMASGGLVTTTVRTDTMLRRDLALHGFDGEFGWRLPAEALGIDRDRFDLRGYVGGFWFDHDALDDPMTGPRARLEWRIEDILPGVRGSRLTFDGSWSDDDIRHSVFSVGARLRIPFPGGAAVERVGLPSDSNDRQLRRLTEALVRDTDVVTQASNQTVDSQTSVTQTGTPYVEEAVVDPVTTVTLTNIVQVDGSGDLQNEITTFGGNTLYVVQGGAGDHARATVPADVTIVGGGAVFDLRGQTSGTVISYTAPGTRGRIVETGGSSALTIGADVHVEGLELVGGGGRSTSVAGNTGILLSDFGADIDIIGNTISGFGENGIDLGVEPFLANVDNNTISDLFGTAVLIQNTSEFIDIQNNAISNVDIGVRTAVQNFDVGVNDNVIENSTVGIHVDNDDYSIYFTGNTIRDASEAGVKFGTPGGGVELDNNVFGGTMPVAVLFTEGAHEITFGTGNTIEAGATLSDNCSQVPSVGTPGSLIGSFSLGGTTYTSGNC
ncbi:MAG: right-handed parallel beta-helix repeat-containing protein [Geminicoccaceae bacterium]